MQIGASSSSANSSGSMSGKRFSSIISSSLSAATKRVRSTLSAQLPSLFPMESKLYMFRTSEGISFKPRAAIFSLPLVLAVATRAWSTLEAELASRFKLKGSSAKPKSNELSVGMTDISNDPFGRAISFCAGTGSAAARLAAFARAICSRSAADDFLNCGDSGAEPAVCVDAVDEAENIVSSPEAVVEDFWDVTEPFLMGSGGKLDFFVAGAEGFLKTPFTDGLGWRVRAATFWGPLGDAGSYLSFPKLGVLDRERRAVDGVAALSSILPFRPTLEGFFIRVPVIRPREVVSATRGSCGIEGLLGTIS